MDPEDVAVGNRTRLQWRPEVEWIRPDGRIHQAALISDDVFPAASLVRA